MNVEGIVKRIKLGATIKEISAQDGISISKIKKALEDQYPLPTLKYHVGVEIEGWTPVGIFHIKESLCSLGIPVEIRSWSEETLTGLKNWVLTTDGSVKGFKDQDEDDKGIEIVSPPIRSKEDFKTLSNILNCIKCPKIMCGKVYKTNKSCGLHIHFGKNEVNPARLKRTYNNYRLLEVLFDRMLSESREFSKKYCRTIEDLTFEEAMDDEQSKYWSVSLKESKPTIEFRKHQGTVDYYKIYYWILILQQLVDYDKEINLVSDFDKTKSYSYLYDIIKNPLLIAYYNTRKSLFDSKKGTELRYVEGRLEKTARNMKLKLEELPF